MLSIALIYVNSLYNWGFLIFLAYIKIKSLSIKNM